MWFFLTNFIRFGTIFVGFGRGERSQLAQNFSFCNISCRFHFFLIFFVCFVKCPFVYFPYFLYIFPFKNKVVVTILKSQIFWAFLKKTGQNWTGSV
jgi:hypothetical protein